MMKTRPTNSAVYYVPDAYSCGPEVMGRQSAGKGFLTGFFRHSRVDQFYCYARSLDQFRDFTGQLDGCGRNGSSVVWIPFGRQDLLRKPGCLFRPDPVLGDLAWTRRCSNRYDYSLCGLTHTICSANALAAVGNLVLAPFEPWDALICTSRAVKQACQHVLEEWGAYVSRRTNGRAHAPVEMPVIPLGVDCSALSNGNERAADRKQIRGRLGIDDDAIVVLFVGRLSYHSKAHPIPMYLALEEAAGRVGRKVTLVQAGWFPSRQVRAEFERCARQYCPSVRMCVVDSGSPEMKRIWCVADLFTSLSDNIQETFGLTPIEAMAAGLPQVVSDWNGYRDTVRDGVDGFRIPTVVPPPGCGTDLALRHLVERASYDRYVGHASLMTAVDVGRCAQAYAHLIGNDSLRRRMGEAARRQAVQEFDWEVVVHRYQQLWSELSVRRAAAAGSAAAQKEPRMPPLRNDPFVTFSGYASSVLQEDTKLRVRAERSQSRLRDLLETPMANYGLPGGNAWRSHCCSTIERLSTGPKSVRDLLAELRPGEATRLFCVIVWLIKFGILTIVDEDCTEEREVGRPEA